MSSINELVERICRDKSLIKIFSTMGVPSCDVEDLCQDLYLNWLMNPESILEAESNGRLRYYLIKACKNQMLKYKDRSSKFVYDEEYLNNLISE